MNGQPDLIIVGAHKCGTTSLMRALEQHSEVARPKVDEPHTLIRDTYSAFRRSGEPVSFVADWDSYSELHSEPAKKTIDGSVLYLVHYKEFLEAYASRLNNSPPVVAILRQPSMRAWSAFNYARLLNSDERETDFASALALDAARWSDPSVSSTLSYRSVSSYGESVAALIDVLGEKFLPVIFEEMVTNFEETSTNVQQHLGLNPERLVLGTSNKGGEWKHGALNRLASNSQVRSLVRRGRSKLQPIDFIATKTQRLGTRSVEMDSGIRKSLDEYFEADISSLEHVLGRDLDVWRSTT